VSLAEAPHDFRAQDYEPILEKWTRQKRLNSIEQMDNVLTVAATYESSEFRQAYTARYARDYLLDPGQERQMLEESLDSSKKYHEFFVALFAQRPSMGDLDEPDPLWVVRLVDSEGHQISPWQIEPDRKPNAMERTYFPYVSPYRKVFRIIFERESPEGPTVSPDADWFGLRFSGARGETTLRWVLAEH
jgi:hypothetical protein